MSLLVMDILERGSDIAPLLQRSIEESCNKVSIAHIQIVQSCEGE
jgi:hypothetical protein